MASSASEDKFVILSAVVAARSEEGSSETSPDLLKEHSWHRDSSESESQAHALSQLDSPAVMPPPGLAILPQARRADSFKDIPVTQSWRLNTALKYIRDTHEDPPGYPRVPFVDITHKDPLPIGVLLRTTGMGYAFQENATQPWSWRQMVAGWGEEAREKICGCGVEAICCMPLRGSFDKKRNHAAKTLRKPYDATTCSDCRTAGVFSLPTHIRGSGCAIRGCGLLRALLM